MSPKNIDETIKKLLQAYAKWCDNIIDKEAQDIQKRKFFTEEDRTLASQKNTRARRANKLLKQIAKNPKQYLYSGKDLIYASDDLYNKLSPILDIPFDKNGKHLLVRLSEKIAYHVKHGKNTPDGVWVYYGNSGSVDLEAEAILKMNKAVQLWNANNLVAAFKDFVPASVYAVDLYKKGNSK